MNETSQNPYFIKHTYSFSNDNGQVWHNIRAKNLSGAKRATAKHYANATAERLEIAERIVSTDPKIGVTSKIVAYRVKGHSWCDYDFNAPVFGGPSIGVKNDE